MKARRERSGGAKVTCLGLAVLAWGADGAAWAADSGMYRGPENNGIYPETGILRKWPEGGPKLLWKRRLSGSGFSSVTVANGHVYATAGGMCELFVFTLDGEEVARIPGGPSTFKRFGGGSRSTTVVRGNMAITTSPLSDVYALDLARQERRWAFDVSKEWGETLGQGGWGYSESPMLYGDKLILGATSTRPEDPFLMAFDVETGEMAWGAAWGDPLDREHHYQSPASSGACFNHEGRRLIAYTAHSYFTLVDAETGRLIWQLRNRGHHDVTPVYNDGYLLWGPCSGWHRVPTEPKLDGLQMMRLSADGASYEVLWTRRENLTEYSHAVILDGRVYVYGRPGTPAEKPDPARAHGPGKRVAPRPPAADAAGGGADAPPEPVVADPRNPAAFLCLDARTGALIASHPLSADFEAPGHVVSADGLVFFLHVVKSARGPIARLFMFEPTDTGFEKTGTLDIPADDDDLRVKEVEWQARTPPVIAEQRLFVRYGSVFAFDVRAEAPSRGWRQDGHGIAAESGPPIRWSEKLNVRWQVDLPVAPGAPPVAAADRIYILGRAGELACLNASDGARLWRQPLRDGSAAPAAQPTPVVRGDRVYAALHDGSVAALRADGSRLWSATVAAPTGRPMASPLIAGRVLAVQGRELTGLDAETGAVLWRTPVPDNCPCGTPIKVAVRGRRLIVTGWGALVNAEDGSVAATGLPVLLRDSPVASGRDLYFWGRATADGKGSRIAALRLSEAKAGPVRFAKRWERTMPEHTPACSPLALDGLLYGLTEEGVLLALDAETGASCYAQRLRGAAAGSDPCPPSLLAAAGRLYAVNADGAGSTCVVESGRRFRDLWSYDVEQGVGEPAFAADRQFVVAGRRILCAGGVTPSEPRAPKVAFAMPMSLPTAPAGLPVAAFTNNAIPGAWLFCGPIPGRDLETDHLAALGGRESPAATAGREITVRGTNFAFRPLLPEHRFTHGQFTSGWPALSVTAALDRRFNSTAYFFTVVSNDAPRYVRFGLHTPNGATWNLKDRLDARVWLGRERVGETEIVKIPKGFCPLLIQVAMGKCEPHGHIWMGPHFEDVTDRYGAMMAEYERASGSWVEYAAKAGSPFAVTDSGMWRTGSDGGSRGVATVAEDRSPAERIRFLDDLRFVAIPERPYEMQATEVTQRQWREVMGTTPWKGQDLTSDGPDYPVTHVSWHEAVAFAQRLTRLDPAHRYRLPLEAEWRHAAQTGLNGRWCFGSGASNLTQYAWCGDNARPDQYAQPVARLKPSAWGLYDINGNVWEWCGDANGRARMAKGGAWYSVDWFCDVGKSPKYGPRFRHYGLGFRLLREKKTIE